MEVRGRARGSTYQGEAGEQEVQGGSELLRGASEVGAEKLKGASRDMAEELKSMGREFKKGLLGLY